MAGKMRELRWKKVKELRMERGGKEEEKKRR